MIRDAQPLTGLIYGQSSAKSLPREYRYRDGGEFMDEKPDRTFVFEENGEILGTYYLE